MNIFRKILIVLVTPVLALSLFLGIITLSLTSYLSSPEKIKQTLSESGIYENLIDNIASEAQKDTKGEVQQEKLPLDNPEIKKIISKAFPPEFWQSGADSIVDGVFVWLNGDSENITFIIDLKKPKENFINLTADYAISRADNLPVCTTPDQIGDPDDLINIACKPPDFNATEIRQKFVTEAQNSEFFGDSDTFSATNLKSENNKPIEEQFLVVKQGYSLAKQLPYALLTLALLLSLVLLLLHETRLKGIKKLKVIYSSAGISILIFSAIGWVIFKKISLPNIKSSDLSSELQTNVLSIANSVFDAIFTVLLIGGVIYVLIGIALWLISKRLAPPKEELPTDTAPKAEPYHEIPSSGEQPKESETNQTKPSTRK